MKSLLNLACAATIALTGAFFSGSVNAQDLIVATDTAFVPFEFKDGDNYTGFDIDMWEAIAKDLDLTYELRPMDFSGIIPALQTGQVDVALAGITIKPSRQEVIDFSDGYYDSGFLLMVSSESDIQGPEDLKGKTPCRKDGDLCIGLCRREFWTEPSYASFPTSTMPISNCAQAGSMQPCTIPQTCSITSRLLAMVR